MLIACRAGPKREVGLSQDAFGLTVIPGMGANGGFNNIGSHGPSDALIGGTYHGAMPYYAIQAIQAANYQITYAQLDGRLNFLLDDAGYPQHPQVEGKRQNQKRQIFS